MFFLLLAAFAFLVLKEIIYLDKLGRLQACGLDAYIEPDDLQEALNTENARAQMLDRVNVEQNKRVNVYWMARGRQMGVIK